MHQLKRVFVDSKSSPDRGEGGGGGQESVIQPLTNFKKKV